MTAIIDRLSSTDKENLRMVELFTAIEQTVNDYCLPLLNRLEGLKSYWSADENDLKYILKKSFGDYFSEITVSAEEKRVYLWGVYQTPFYKHSEDLIRQAFARLSLSETSVQIHQYYWNPVDPYLPINYHTESDLIKLEENLDDYVALSEIELRFDEDQLALSGHDAALTLQVVEDELKNILPDHLQVSYYISEATLAIYKSLVFGNTKQVYEVVTQN